MDPLTMVVAIVAIVTLGGIIRAKHGLRKDGKGNLVPMNDPDAARMRDEMKQMKERIAVLERLATDDTSSLDREIERLRDRDRV